jgi:hypothetical protein
MDSTGSPYLLLDYREMMGSDTEIERLQDFVGVPLKDMRRNDLYRVNKPRTDMWLGLADWLMQKVRGVSTRDILLRLARLRGVSGKSVTS